MIRHLTEISTYSAATNSSGLIAAEQEEKDQLLRDLRLTNPRDDNQKYEFHIRPCIDGTAQPIVVSCTSKRLKEIEQRSVVLKQRIKDPKNRKGIPLETDDAAGIDFDALGYLVQPPLSSGMNPGSVRPDDLSRHCNAFWKYQWMPESASILWAHLDQSEVESQSQHETSSERCWQQKTSIVLQQRSLYLINIAIVFGLDESLRERMDKELRQQIPTAVWNSNLDARIKTSVGFLNKIEGCIDITKSIVNR